MRHAWWSWYLAAALVLSAVLVTLPARPQALLYVVVGVSSAVAICVGTRLHRPARPLAWHLMAAGALSWSAGDAVYGWHELVLDREPFPSSADALYLAAYPLLGAGLLLLLGGRRSARDLPGLVDSLVVTAGLALLFWVVLAGPALGEPGDSLASRLVAAAYPVGDVLLLGALVRLVTASGARSTAFRLLVGSTALLAIADTAFAVVSARDSYDQAADALSLLWLSSYALLGACALHPTMRALSEPGAPRLPHLSRVRLAALTAAVLVAPAILAVQHASGEPVDGWAVALATTGLGLLVLLRLSMTTTALEHEASHDGLTSLANRGHLMLLASSAIRRVGREGTGVGLLLVDLDRFTSINDAHGQCAGDLVLQQTARRLAGAVRAGDVVCRLGSDQFAVLVDPVPSPAGLVDLAGRVLADLTEPMRVHGRVLHVGASVGVTTGTGVVDAGQLLTQAVTAVERAKAAGRGRVEVFDEALGRELRRRADLESGVRRGLSEDEFVLHYQPLVGVTSGLVLGYEALVRWQAPGRGLVPPREFVADAERSDLICELGRWVLHEAARQLSSWVLEDPVRHAATTVAVNLSGRHLLSPRVVADVTAALTSADLPAWRLVLEITETVLVDEPTATERLGALRSLGVSVSLDDFGTGYTSIRQLQHLPVDALKIDQSFVRSTEPGTRELVDLMIKAAHAFGLKVVAEGVEEPAQLRALAELDCDYAQGFLLGRPGPAVLVGADCPSG